MHARRMLRRAVPALALGLAGATLALLSASCGDDSAASSTGGVPGGAKTIYLTAMEYKGSAEVSKEPLPTAKLPEGGGYVLKDPTGDPPKWEVESYAWAPASFTAVEGDQVTLQIVGINGAKHESELEGHDQQFTVKRGEVTTVTFTAGAPGVYTLVCKTHPPNMTAQLVVLPAAK
ncbi:MAG: cupredoxin domain-containing protein [Chloroflexi bacterium]|nr:cupredoxin domain-containing protein [Chloroflexota bacterium]